MGWGRFWGFAGIGAVGVFGACGPKTAKGPSQSFVASQNSTGGTKSVKQTSAPVATATARTTPQMPVAQAMKREAIMPRSRYKLTFPNGMTLEPESTKEPILKVSQNALGQSIGKFELMMDDVEVSCAYNPNLLDLGDLMQQATAPQSDLASLKQVEFSLDNAEGVPIPKWTAYYHSVEQGAPVLGSISISTFLPEGGGTLACSYYGLGYRVSIDTIMRNMVLSHAPRVVRVYAEASKVFWNDVPVGYVSHWISKSAQGFTTRTLRSVFTILMNGPFHQDGGAFAESDKTGKLLRAGSSHAGTDAAIYSREITRIGEGEYEWAIAHGETKDSGKVRGVITSSLEDARTLRLFVEGKIKNPTITFLAEDPVRIETFNVTKDGKGIVTLIGEKLPEQCTVDQDGRCSSRVEGRQRTERVLSIGQYPAIH